MVPFVRTVDVFRKTVKIMQEEGLDHKADSSFQLWILSEATECGFHDRGILQRGNRRSEFRKINPPDTMLVLGVDRNDTSVQEDPRREESRCFEGDCLYNGCMQKTRGYDVHMWGRRLVYIRITWNSCNTGRVHF